MPHPSPVQRTTITAVVACTLVAGALTTAPPAQATATGCAFGTGWPTPNRVLADRLGGLVNDYRARKGLRRLSVNRALQTAAEWKAAHMARHGYFSHDDPGDPPRNFAARIAACGYRAASSENLAWSSASSPSGALNAWLGSPGHRRQLDSASYREMGVGVARAARGDTYWVQTFGGGSSQTPRRSVARVSRVGTLGRHSVQRAYFDMKAAGTARITVRALNRRGRRAFRVTLSCGSRRLGVARGRRGRTATITRRISRGRCTATVTSARQPLRYRITLTTR